jgi:V/A-type H+-transporting ATPase subunit D
MALLKLTKNELRNQQHRLAQLEKYLPTLQLKKAMLQSVVNEARLEILVAEEEIIRHKNYAEDFSPLLGEKISVNPLDAVQIVEVKKHWENVAGVEVPYFDAITFKDFEYSLFDTPAWLDSVVIGLRNLAASKAKVSILRQKKQALEKEFREVSIRVNLFEKVLIPRAQDNIKKIKIFLGDQQLAAVSRAKVAKTKIEQNKRKYTETPHNIEGE